MIPYIHAAEFKIGPIVLQVWGIFVAFGFLAGIIAAYEWAKRAGKDAGHITAVSFWIILSSFIFARLFYAVGHFEYFWQNPAEVLKIWEGGMSFYGGFAGALAALLVYAKKNKLPVFSLSDSLAFALPLGIFIGRIGCFLIHDHIGKLTDSFLGMPYIDGTTRFEPSILESFFALTLFLLFLALTKLSWTKNSGFYTALFMILYPIARFFLDFLRSADFTFSDSRLWGSTYSQYASLAVLFFGVYLMKKFIIQLKNKL